MCIPEFLSHFPEATGRLSHGSHYCPVCKLMGKCGGEENQWVGGRWLTWWLDARVVVVAETITLLICNIFAVSFHLVPLLQHRPAAAVSNIPPTRYQQLQRPIYPFSIVFCTIVCVFCCGVRVCLCLSLSLGWLLQVKWMGELTLSGVELFTQERPDA
jgi:hypothetical protein